MTALSDANLEILRKRPQQTKLYLSIFQPQAIFKARINNSSIDDGAREIAFDTVSLGSYTDIVNGQTMWVGSEDGEMDLGKIRVRSATSSVITVSENSDIDWEDNAYLTVFKYWELWPVFPRIISDPADDENVIFYKDYDIPYSNQNSILGTFVNIGPHRAAWLDPASGQKQLYYTSSGTYNILGNSLNYNWQFEGGTPSSSSSANPGYVTYNTSGNYITSLTVSGSNGAIDTTYRTVRIHNQANPPVQKWQLLSLGGSRDEGGYTASFKVFEEIPIQEHAVVVIFGENWYGDTQANLGGNYPNGGEIFWVGYVNKDSINYDYQHSEMTFDAQSITGMMKESSGFSVSVESKANPAKWFELLDMDCRRAIYHYLKWHTTALLLSDFQFVGDDYKIQFFDADRESMFDAIDNLMRNTLIGQVVSDRQGKVWIEVEAKAYSDPFASFPPVMTITDRDWMNEPSIEERLSEDMAFIEVGGIAYSGVVTGTFSALLASAPGNAPGFHGSIETHEGLALLGQSQLNRLAGNLFANANSPFPTIGMELGINASNLDIAPQETIKPNVGANDTVRDIAINGRYIPNRFSWAYSPQDRILLPQMDMNQLVFGVHGETIRVASPEEVGGGYIVPGVVIPPLPPITFPPFSLSNTGSSCCDALTALGIGLGVYSGIFNSGVTPPTPDLGLGIAIGYTYASNPNMYTPSNGRISFLNTGTISYIIEITAGWQQVTETSSTTEIGEIALFSSTGSGEPSEGGGGRVIRLMIGSPGYNGGGDVQDISSGVGDSGVVTKTLTLTGAYPKVPNYLTTSITGNSSPQDFQIVWSGISVKITGTP